jgi:rubrerythrin
MPKYQVRAFIAVESIHTYHVEADSLDEAKLMVKEGSCEADIVDRFLLEDSETFEGFDDPTCELLDDSDSDEDEDTFFVNHYSCPRCGYVWQDDHPSQPDDDCEACGMRHISPHLSELQRETA